MKKLCIVILSVLMFTSCANAVYYHPHKNTHDFGQDLAECQYEAEKYGHVAMWGSGFGAGLEEGLRKSKLTKMCMQLKGWTTKVIHR